MADEFFDLNGDAPEDDEPIDTAPSTTASLPGRIVLDLRVYLRCFPYVWMRPLIVCLAWAMPLVVTIQFHQSFAARLIALAVLVVAVAAQSIRVLVEWVQLKSHLYHGCANPAVVVSMNPFLIAVYADLTHSLETSYPVVKVFRAPLGRVQGSMFQVGDRVPTVSTYGGMSSWHYDDFYPIPACCATRNMAAIDRLNDALEYEHEGWETLDTALEYIPMPLRPGIFPAVLFHRVSEAIATPDERANIPGSQEYGEARERQRKRLTKGLFYLGGAVLVSAIFGVPADTAAGIGMTCIAIGVLAVCKFNIWAYTGLNPQLDYAANQHSIVYFRPDNTLPDVDGDSLSRSDQRALTLKALPIVGGAFILLRTLPPSLTQYIPSRLHSDWSLYFGVALFGLWILDRCKVNIWPVIAPKLDPRRDDNFILTVKIEVLPEFADVGKPAGDTRGED